MRPLRGFFIGSVLLIGGLLVAQPAMAQQPAAANQSSSSNDTEDSGGIGIGVEAMAGFPSLSNAGSGLDAKNSYGFGLWVGGNRNGTVGFTGEFIYLVKKEKLGEAEAKHVALEIPAVFHINFGKKKTKNGPLGYAVLGPVFTINVQDKLSGGLTGNNFQSANVGIMYGAGFEIARLAIEARMNQNLKQVTSNGGGVFADSKERVFEVVGKFRFN